MAACAVGRCAARLGYEAYTPLARVRTIAHARRLAPNGSSAALAPALELHPQFRPLFGIPSTFLGVFRTLRGFGRKFA